MFPHKSTAQKMIMITRSSTEIRLSVRNISKPLILERRYSMEDSKNWLNAIQPNRYNCSPLNPMSSAAMKVMEM